MPGASFADTVRASGLVSENDRGVVLVSGGADSVGLLTGLAEVVPRGNLVVLHVNYGLREAADADEDLVRRLCDRLGVELAMRRAGAPGGNLQAWAREFRLREAEQVRDERKMDWVAVGHTRSDLAETFLYRLVSSPGVRPLLAMPPRSGHVIRPLLALDRGQVRAMLPEGSYAEDATNEDPKYARNRIRHRVLPELQLINEAAELNIDRTRLELEEDDATLTGLADRALEGPQEPGHAVQAEALLGQPPAVRRRMIRRLAERELDRPVRVSVELTAEASRLAARPEGGRVDLGAGDSLVIEGGGIRIRPAGPDERVPDPVPFDRSGGTVLFGEWRVEVTETREEEARAGFGDPWTAFLDLDGASPWLRGRRPGDRIEPLGMSGSKTLQDVFTDGLVPAHRREVWPVLAVGDTVVWVPGLVRSRHYLIGGPDRAVLRLQASPPFPI